MLAPSAFPGVHGCTNTGCGSMQKAVEPNCQNELTLLLQQIRQQNFFSVTQKSRDKPGFFDQDTTITYLFAMSSSLVAAITWPSSAASAAERP